MNLFKYDLLQYVTLTQKCNTLSKRLNVNINKLLRITVDKHALKPNILHIDF